MKLNTLQKRKCFVCGNDIEVKDIITDDDDCVYVQWKCDKCNFGIDTLHNKVLLFGVEQPFDDKGCDQELIFDSIHIGHKLYNHNIECTKKSIGYSKFLNRFGTGDR